MKLPGYAIRIILTILFFAAVGARFASTKDSTYPYFKGSAAMNYRGVTTVAEGRDLDRQTAKSNWPEGFRPARLHAPGVEYLVGYSYKVAKYLSEIEARKFCRRLLVLFFALTVFFIYAITVNLWGSQAAGVFAAFLLAFFPPLIEITNGKTFTQLPFAIVFALFHILTILRYAKDNTWKKAVITGIAAFFLLAVWDLGAFYTVAVIFIFTLFSPLRPKSKRLLTVIHLAAFLTAAVSVPYLQSLRLAFSWQSAALAACCLYTFVYARFPSRGRAFLFIVAAGAILFIATIPLRAGAEQGLPLLKYVFYRIRFLFAKPADPQMLPDAVRLLWSSDHASPSANALLSFFFLVLLFIPATVMSARRMWSQNEPNRRWHIACGVGLALALCLIFSIDRSAVAAASVAVAPVLALGLIGTDRQLKSRGPLLAVGTLLILVQLLSPWGNYNAIFQITKNAGIASTDKSKFLWVSLDNTDSELIRFVASRTSVSDPVLGPPDITAVLLTFSGRTSVLLAGYYAEAAVRKQIELGRLFYGPEEDFYRKCKELGIKYILYSIDMVLDSSRYGPAYLSGIKDVPDECVALDMQFSPESLTNFNLVYENHHYRLYKVTDEFEPYFTTDHLPVYQREIFDRHDDTYESFHQRIIQLIVTYSAAERSIATGDNEGAIQQLNWCLDRAPRFTRARVALGSVLLQMGRIEEARDQLLSVVYYAPDNPLALYYAAYALALLEDTGQARGLLKILYGLTNDDNLLSRARLLESMIDQGVSVAPDSTTPGNE